jgi:transcriptional regulator of acetoin/glycerol metabolism
MSNPWLAIDVATAPVQRARELRRAWERFIGGETETGSSTGTAPLVRDPIAASWRRSAAAGVDPSGLRIAPVVADADEAAARWEVHPLATMAPLIRACLAATADESRHLIVVSDAAGMLLWVEGYPRVRLRAADSMNFAEGALWSEGGAGTNAIGTALAAEHAVQVFASEHFSEVVQ